eukprot:CAMPEP_0119334522 /NCGR_PEP_ID=MMETSP1333-20130426/87493_1 /TAXON_ID=418940 /ORGANISM="Scyphosphaera apsteinii, Strain RCC1455" /LENGTH=78 /DNA_ID=CAMNT_0007344829 /DNA_START=19 /DNA_END=255 /DNA_ORIENTATION=-
MSLTKCLVLLVGTVAFDAEKAGKQPSFNKVELEELLRKDHSDRISNIYDSENNIQYTWNIERQELCPGVDGKCSKEEL